MPTHHPNIFINEKLQSSFISFLTKTLKNFRDEMNCISQAFYQYKVPNQEHFGVDNLFASIERTWVGMFNNALVRNSDIAVLQEFAVWNSERNIGRCDLLFRFNEENEDVDIVTEAKCYEFFNNWNMRKDTGFYKRILDQAYKYYIEEKIYYEKDVKLMAIVFEWIRNSEYLQIAKNIMTGWEYNNDPETDFLTLYYGNTRGVFVYGKIISIGDYENKMLLKHEIL
jgi:hypothetical protein